MDLQKYRSPSLRSLCDCVVYWAPPIDDGHGERTWDMPRQCWGRFLDAVELVGQDTQLEEGIGTVVIDYYCIGTIPAVNGYVWKGDLRALSTIDEPPFSNNNIVRRIMHVRVGQPMNNRLTSLAILRVK